MPNVLFTQRCVRSCPYCFAEKHMSSTSPDDVLSWENLIYITDLLSTSGERKFQILGGEPTLHPAFNDMVVYLLERNFDVTVFTSGIMKNKTLQTARDLFASLPKEKLSFVINLNDPHKTGSTPSEVKKIRKFLTVFGERSVPGFNIYRLDFELDFLFQYILEFGMLRTIRIGVAHPILGKKNQFISVDDMDQVIRRLFSYAPTFERLRIKPGLDCGFPLCRFDDRQLAWLLRHQGGKYDFGCGPVIDIGPDLSVWSCFPLSGFKKRSLFEFNSIKEIHEYYERLHHMIKVEAGGIYEDCDNCLYREDGTCKGGCLAHNLTCFQNEQHLRMEEVYDEQSVPGSTI